MTVEVINARIENKNIIFTYIDISEERLEYLERTRRDDIEPREFELIYNSKNPRQAQELQSFLKSLSKALKEKPATWGEAIQLTVGRTIELNQYRRF